MKLSNIYVIRESKRLTEMQGGPSYAMARQAVVIVRKGAEAVRASGKFMADVDQTESWLIGLLNKSGAPMNEEHSKKCSDCGCDCADCTCTDCPCKDCHHG